MDPPRRRSIRLAGFDYTQNRSYFVTACAATHGYAFGRIVNGGVRPSELGSIVTQEWEKTISLRPYVEFDEFVVMPNHFHALFTLLREGMLCHNGGCPTRTDRLIGPTAQSVGAIERGFKSAVTRRARMELGHLGPIWQRNYYDRIIHNDQEFLRARDYILRNPEKWEEDKENYDRRL